MKESRAEQVFKSFVAGNTEHTQSPLLSISGYCLMQRERGGMKRKMRQQKIVALNMEGVIVHPIMARGASQVLGMLHKVKAHEVDDAAFGLISNAMREHFGSFQMLRSFIGRSNPESFVRGFLKTLTDNRIPNPYGETIDDFLRFINRRYLRDGFAAALRGVIRSGNMRELSNAEFISDLDVAEVSVWTFYKDETEALMLRLADTNNRMTFVKLRQA